MAKSSSIAEKHAALAIRARPNGKSNCFCAEQKTYAALSRLRTGADMHLTKGEFRAYDPDRMVVLFTMSSFARRPPSRIHSLRPVDRGDARWWWRRGLPRFGAG